MANTWTIKFASLISVAELIDYSTELKRLHMLEVIASLSCTVHASQHDQKYRPQAADAFQQGCHVLLSLEEEAWSQQQPVCI